jgi:hypothetical protein
VPSCGAADGVEYGVVSVKDQVSFYLIVEECANFNGRNCGNGWSLPLPAHPAGVNDAWNEFEQCVDDPCAVECAVHG